MIGLLALLGFGTVAAKQEIGKTCDSIDSRAAAKRKGSKTYVDGCGNVRWTENAHLLLRSMDDKGFPCWYDLDAGKVVDNFGYRQHLKEEKKKREYEAEAKKELDERREKWDKEIKEIKEKEERRKEREMMDAPIRRWEEAREEFLENKDKRLQEWFELLEEING